MLGDGAVDEACFESSDDLGDGIVTVREPGVSEGPLLHTPRHRWCCNRVRIQPSGYADRVVEPLHRYFPRRPVPGDADSPLPFA